MRLAVTGGDCPDFGGLIENGFFDAGLKLDEWSNFKLVGRALKVSEDLRLSGVFLRPIVSAVKRKRIEVRRDIATGIRIVIIEPRSTNIGGFFEDLECLDSRALTESPDRVRSYRRLQ